MQLEDPAIRWQMALYRDLPHHQEDTSDPDKTVERVLVIAHVLFHLDQVCPVWRLLLTQVYDVLSLIQGKSRK